MILICGLPSSGTSWVCDTLARHGFDLGNYRPWLHPIRGYRTYEDSDLYDEVMRGYPESLPLNKIQAYVDRRRAEGNPVAKYPWFGVLGDKAPEVEGVRWVITKRNLAKVMEQERKRRPDSFTQQYFMRVDLLHTRLQEMREALDGNYHEVKHGDLNYMYKRKELVDYCRGR